MPETQQHPAAINQAPDGNRAPVVSPADISGLHAQIQSAIGPDFASFCGDADAKFGARSERAKQARNVAYALGVLLGIGGLALNVLSIDRFGINGNWLLMGSGLFVFALVVVDQIFMPKDRALSIDAAEMTLALLSDRSTLTTSKEGYGFARDDHDDFASIVGGPFPPEGLIAHSGWRRGWANFDAVYAADQNDTSFPTRRHYLFRIERKGDDTAPVFVVPEGIDIPGLMASPPGTDEPPLAISYSVDLGDPEFARHFRCYSADPDAARAVMHGVMRATLIALSSTMDTKRLRLAFLGDSIVGVVGPLADGIYLAANDDGPVLDPNAALTVLRDLSIPLVLIDGLIAAETNSAAIAAVL